MLRKYSLYITCYQIWILLCTDLLSRGIDFRGIECVVNYDLPQSKDDYINRIGRAGRGNKIGKAVTLYTLNDVPKMGHIVEIAKNSGFYVPAWLENKAKGK